MPNPPKYNDFLEVGRVTKQFHGTEVAFAQFACPMNGCNVRVNVRADDVDKQKSSRCLHHLKRCGSTEAAEDPRVCGKRKSPPSDEKSSSPAEDARHTLARHDLETRLDTARAEKASSDAKVYDLERRMRTMEDDMCAMKQFQSTIAHKLGFTTPPLPTVDQCLAVLEGMEKSRAVANMCNSSLPEAQARELRKAKKNHEAAMTANAALRKQVDELRKLAGSQPKLSTHRDRKLMKLFHPDNYPNEPPVVRAAMVKAFKLVSESRQDA